MNAVDDIEYIMCDIFFQYMLLEDTSNVFSIHYSYGYRGYRGNQSFSCRRIVLMSWLFRNRSILLSVPERGLGLGSGQINFARRKYITIFNS